MSPENRRLHQISPDLAWRDKRRFNENKTHLARESNSRFPKSIPPQIAEMLEVIPDPIEEFVQRHQAPEPSSWAAKPKGGIPEKKSLPFSNEGDLRKLAAVREESQEKKKKVWPRLVAAVAFAGLAAWGWSELLKPSSGSAPKASPTATTPEFPWTELSGPFEGHPLRRQSPIIELVPALVPTDTVDLPEEITAPTQPELQPTVLPVQSLPQVEPPPPIQVEPQPEAQPLPTPEQPPSQSTNQSIAETQPIGGGETEIVSIESSPNEVSAREINNFLQEMNLLGKTLQIVREEREQVWPRAARESEELKAQGIPVDYLAVSVNYREIGGQIAEGYFRSILEQAGARNGYVLLNVPDTETAERALSQLEETFSDYPEWLVRVGLNFDATLLPGDNFLDARQINEFLEMRYAPWHDGYYSQGVQLSRIKNGESRPGFVFVYFYPESFLKRDAASRGAVTHLEELRRYYLAQGVVVSPVNAWANLEMRPEGIHRFRGLTEQTMREEVLNFRRLDLTARAVDKADNMLLALRHLNGERVALPVDWEAVRQPFEVSFVLQPGQTFSFHPNVLPEFSSPDVVLDLNFSSSRGYKTVGYLDGSGVCHLATLINWVASEAGLETRAPTRHIGGPVHDIPSEYDTAILTSQPEQNLYLRNTLSFPVEFVFEANSEEITLSIVGLSGELVNLGVLDQRWAEYRPLVERILREEGLDFDVNLIGAMIAVESCFIPDNVSWADSRGLMQLWSGNWVPGTAEHNEFVNNWRDAGWNIRAGVGHLADDRRYCINAGRSDLRCWLIAYNGGRGTIGNPLLESVQFADLVMAVKQGLDEGRSLSGLIDINRYEACR